MYRSLTVRTLVLTLGLGASLGAAAQVQPPTQSVKVQGVKDPSEWRRAEGPHVVVYSDTRAEDVRALVRDLERLDHVLRVYLRDYLRLPLPTQKLTLYFPERTGDFAGVAGDAPTKAVGLYASCPAAVQGFGVAYEPVPVLAGEQLVGAPLSESQSYIFEAYARHFVYRYTGIRAPAAFIDGIAQFFGGTRFSDTLTMVGRAPTAIARYLAFLDASHPYSLKYRDVLDDAAWKASGYAGTGYAGPEGVALEYRAKSWLLAHYMLSTEERRKQMDVYLNQVHDGLPAVAAFEQAFGMRIDDVDTAMWRYRRKDAYVVRADFGAPAAVPIDMVTLTRAAGDVVLASAALKSCPDRKTGVALLDQLARQSAQAAGNELMLLTLSRAQIDWGNPNDAVAPLTALLAARPRHPEALLLLGLAQLRLADGATAEVRTNRLASARGYLKQARALDPGAPDAAYWLSRAELESGAPPADAALPAAIAASRNAPEVPTLARTAALAHAYAGHAHQAASALAVLARNDADPASARWATDWQKRLAVGVSRTDLVAEMRREPANPAFREWTVASGDVLKTVECNAGLVDGRRQLESALPENTQEQRLAKMNVLQNMPRRCAE